MAALHRKLASLASAAFARLRAWGRELRERARLTRRHPGARLALPLKTAPAGPPATCCGCGSPATTFTAPARALRTLTGPVPAVQVGLCSPCFALVASHRRFQLLSAGIAAVFGLSCMALLFALRPWSGWPLMSAAAAAGALLAVAVRLLRAARPLPLAGWLGVPARWRRRRAGAVELETPCAALISALQHELGPEVPVRAVVATERDAGAILLLAALLAAVVAPVAWLELHPVVRILNLGTGPLRVVIDGREAGSVAASWTEAPNAGLRIRVPAGERRFEAFDRDERVDVVRGEVHRDRPVVYAPAHQPFCLWIEQRAYGNEPPPRPAVLRLPPEQTLYTLPVRVDGWFQPNPAANARDRFFSGGIRRALRHGRCSPLSSP